MLCQLSYILHIQGTEDYNGFHTRIQAAYFDFFNSLTPRLFGNHLRGDAGAVVADLEWGTVAQGTKPRAIIRRRGEP